ncbi:peptidase [Halarcobacter ebronensis]|uniref:Peptidase n=1 Tax=Halarcobacter ebronensis TaxID=1462615 RepID=A0A4Q0YI96_9BACT|nr:S24 family peptidase [Halarcobacter ebronensis]RXJ68581.1 peptidase [Halarcobacter ebronensis]
MENINLEYTDIFDDNKVKKLSFSKHIIKSEFNEKSLFALMVDGKSMQPVINHKGIIVADLSQKTLIDEAVYLVYYENKMWVKKYIQKNKTFTSINKDFSHLVYKENEVYVVAKVLISFTNL